MPASRYSYQFPISEVRPSIQDEFFEDVIKNRPKVFIVQGGYVKERAIEFLDTHNYKEIWRDVVIDEKTSKETTENTSRIYLLEAD